MLFYDAPEPPAGIFDAFLAIPSVLFDVKTRSFLSLIHATPSNSTMGARYISYILRWSLFADMPFQSCVSGISHYFANAQYIGHSCKRIQGQKLHRCNAPYSCRSNCSSVTRSSGGRLLRTKPKYLCHTTSSCSSHQYIHTTPTKPLFPLHATSSSSPSTWPIRGIHLNLMSTFTRLRSLAQSTSSRLPSPKARLN